MQIESSRRTFLTAVPLGLGAVALGRGALAADQPVTQAAESRLWPTLPQQDPEVVRAVVGASHRDEKLVRELVGKQPALANATWDWGFGDWETALGAAAHTGRRGIAEFLIASGARVDIFAAAMLGQLDTVKAMIAAIPGVQRTLGPHCIPLLSHAKAGGEGAKAVVEYLEQLGDAGKVPESRKLTEQEQQRYIGVYEFGPAESDRLVVTQDKGSLWLSRASDTKRGLSCVADHAFFPAGAPAVRIEFEVRGDAAATSLTVVDGLPLVKALRR